MKVVFLDIDGVLNSKNTKAYTPSGCCGIEKALLKRLRRIIESTGAKVVLSSTWKTELDKNLHPVSPDGKYMLNKFLYEGKFFLFDKTIDSGNSFNRGKEIVLWLEEHNYVTEFVILDDIYFDDFDRFGLTDRFVNTDPTIGLTDENVETAIAVLNGKRMEQVDEYF